MCVRCVGVLTMTVEEDWSEGGHCIVVFGGLVGGQSIGSLCLCLIVGSWIVTFPEMVEHLFIHICTCFPTSHPGKVPRR